MPANRKKTESRKIPDKKSQVLLQALEGEFGENWRRIKVARAEFVRRRLDQFYPGPPKPPLQHQDSFTLLVAVLLSAQCTDKKVNEVTPRLFQWAPTPQLMVELGQEKILEIIRPCGLSPQKSKAIVGLSKILIDKHASKVPASFEDLEELPGVGHKTASVVMSQAFGVPAFPVDTHIHRLAARWKLSSGQSVQQTERDLKNLFLEKHWNDLHLKIIFYGREFCTARGCSSGKKCDICSILAR